MTAAVILTTTCLALSSVVSAQRLALEPVPTERRVDVQITGHIFKPSELPAPQVSQLHVPRDFRIEKFAEHVGSARILAVGPDGAIYATRREEGDVLMFKPGPNGLAAGTPVRMASRAGLHGIAFSDGKVYIATVHEIF